MKVFDESHGNFSAVYFNKINYNVHLNKLNKLI